MSGWDYHMSTLVIILILNPNLNYGKIWIPHFIQ